jgi:hypothetical protein
MTLAEVIDDHFLDRYRALLDAEDNAFDELEHAYEDGDREHFELDLRAWQDAISRKLDYLRRKGVDVDSLISAPAGISSSSTASL